MKILFPAILLISSFFCSAQQKYSLTIKFDSQIDKKKFVINIENGNGTSVANLADSSTTLYLNGKYYSKYVTLTISYSFSDENTFYKRYWISSKPAVINFKKRIYPGKSPEIIVSSLQNTIDIDETFARQSAAMNKYVKKEANAISALWDSANYYRKAGSFDSLDKVRFISWMNKSLNFIKRNNQEYYFFWYYLDQFYGRIKTFYKKDTLLRLYVKDKMVTTFSKKLIRSYEGKRVLFETDVLLKSKINIPVPAVKAIDYLGKKFEVSNYKGKYVLFDFWASWCVPCMKSLPKLNEIRNTFPADKLIIISVNYDKDSAAFIKAVNAYNMNWVHVIDNEQKFKQWFPDFSLPTMILINKEGYIVYNRSGFDDSEDIVRLFETMIL